MSSSIEAFFSTPIFNLHRPDTLACEMLRSSDRVNYFCNLITNNLNVATQSNPTFTDNIRSIITAAYLLGDSTMNALKSIGDRLSDQAGPADEREPSNLANIGAIARQYLPAPSNTVSDLLRTQMTEHLQNNRGDELLELLTQSIWQEGVLYGYNDMFFQVLELQANHNEGFTENIITQIIKCLLATNTINVIQWPRIVGTPALTQAARQGHTRAVEFLLENSRVNPNLRNMIGHTALMLAAFNGHAETVSTLINNSRINLNLRNPSGNSALMLAALWGRTEVVRALLVDQRVEPNLTNREGNNALMLATHHGHAGVVEVLIADQRVDLNLRNEEGNTAQAIASMQGHAEIEEALLTRIKTLQSFETT